MDNPFLADPEKCTACGLCVKDCPVAIIGIEKKVAQVAPERAGDCIDCQHCLAICPAGAVTLNGRDPSASASTARVDADLFARFMQSRRSVRQFAPGVVDKMLMGRLLNIVASAPTGANARDRRFTAILDTEVLAQFRKRLAETMVAGADRVPEDMSWFTDMARNWLAGGRDELFRNAPHLLVVTAGPNAATPQPDCMIALSYFDLLAQANGVGTVWCGLVETAMRFFPECRDWLGIPDDHCIGYAMLFGPDGTHYPRVTQHKVEGLAILERLG